MEIIAQAQAAPPAPVEVERRDQIEYRSCENVVARIERLEAGQEITRATLVEAGFAKQGQLIKILANGEISKALTIEVDKVSSQAKELIEKAGGSVVEASPATE